MKMNLGTLSATFVFTVSLTLILRPLAIRIGLVDRPCGGRKRHHGEVPLVGGIAIFLGVMASQLIFGDALHGKVLLWCGAFLLLLGVADDFLNLSAKVRLVGQTGVALVTIFGSGIILQNLGDILFTGNPVSLGILAVPVTVFCFVGVINAMNMVDGVDGLAGGLALVSLSALSYFSVNASTWHILFLGPAVAATAGFLLLNARNPFSARAKIFMGDAGSMFLGCILATMFIDMSQGSARVFSPATALWIFAVPLMDTVGVIIRRGMRGQSPFRPGRDHVHHILIRSGLSVGQTTVVLIVTGILLACVGVAGHQWGISTKAMFFAFLGTFAVYFWSTSRGWRYIHKMKRQRLREERVSKRLEVGWETCSEEQSPHIEVQEPVKLTTDSR